MSETENIAKIAEIISSTLFSEFLWEGSFGKLPTNEDWTCMSQELHAARTHPTDVAFWYDAPYSPKRVYVTTDLKSYAAGSITEQKLKPALRSLAASTSCANISPEWRDKFVLKGNDVEVVGLLFIYNHDGEYDRDFTALLEKSARKLDLSLSPGRRVVVLGPREIFELHNISLDLRLLKGSGTFPQDKKRYGFYYPNLLRHKLSQQRANRPATIEMLTSQWIPIEYEDPKTGFKSLLIYYRNGGDDSQEFIYLIDYLLHYQLLQSHEAISIRYFGENKNASVYFAKAIEEYKSRNLEIDPNEETLNSIQFESVNHFKTVFSTLEIGMRDA